MLPSIIVPKSATNKQTKMDDFIKKHAFPIIVKPDVAHRGIDVHLVKNKKSLLTFLKQQKWDYLLQKYDNSPMEFGVFYVRYPNEKKGRIVSMTEKQIPEI